MTANRHSQARGKASRPLAVVVLEGLMVAFTRLALELLRALSLAATEGGPRRREMDR